ncbi:MULTISPECIES: YtcA family lipoprotein [Paraburkholderia]|uniref:YtcA family lipoprotein n=1 Tax=Paraburkholderia unamae TaxID=219649 RepID=A0ACC6RJS8_9BURK
MPLITGGVPTCTIGAAVTATAFMSGCANYSPSLNVLGAYFPDWLFCIIAGVVLTVVIYLVLKRFAANHLLAPAAVVYPTLVAFLSLALWLALFQY